MRHHQLLGVFLLHRVMLLLEIPEEANDAPAVYRVIRVRHSCANLLK